MGIPVVRGWKGGGDRGVVCVCVCAERVCVCVSLEGVYRWWVKEGVVVWLALCHGDPCDERMEVGASGLGGGGGFEWGRVNLCGWVMWGMDPRFFPLSSLAYAYVYTITLVHPSKTNQNTAAKGGGGGGDYKGLGGRQAGEQQQQKGVVVVEQPIFRKANGKMAVPVTEVKGEGEGGRHCW
jgi:hypothetical protein